MKQPDRLGRYRIVCELGSGAMGSVFEAIDDRLERTVAVKTIALGASQEADAEFRARFDREAKSAARLNHPGIVTVYESGEDDGVAYISMEFLKGRSLRTLLDGGHRFEVSEVIEIGIAAAEALEFAHENGVVHRDIKPSNLVRLETGAIKITDFGVAHYVNDDLTQVGSVIGTPKYMSPEQVNSDRVDGRSDLFSLGVVLYELAAGQAPFVGSSIASIMFQVINHKPMNPSIIDARIPEALSWVIGRCLAKRPADRYSSGRALADDLRRLDQLRVPRGALDIMYSSNGTQPKSREQPPGEATVNLQGRERRPSWALIGGAAALIVVAVVGTFFGTRIATRKPAAPLTAVSPTIAPGGSMSNATAATAPAPAAPASVAPTSLPAPVTSVPATLAAPTPGKSDTKSDPPARATPHHESAPRAIAKTAAATKLEVREDHAPSGLPAAAAPADANRNEPLLSRVGLKLKELARRYRECISGTKCEAQPEPDHSYSAGN